MTRAGRIDDPRSSAMGAAFMQALRETLRAIDASIAVDRIFHKSRRPNRRANGGNGT
jgi:hypothetical protein